METNHEQPSKEALNRQRKARNVATQRDSDSVVDSIDHAFETVVSPLANQGKPDKEQRQRQRIQNDQDSRES